MDKETYLGDGVYASFDGYQIWLRAERDGIQHRIAIESEVYDSLVAYVKAKPWQVTEDTGQVEE